MENFHEIYPIILEEFQRGSTEGEVFKRICQERGLILSSSSTASWKNRIRTRDFEKEIVELRHRVTCAITGEYLKFKKAIVCLRNFGRRRDMMLSDRYLLSDHGFPGSFMLLDSFNGRSRNVQSEVQQPLAFRVSSSVLIGDDRVLCRKYDNNVVCPYLLKLNSDAFTYSILDEHVYDFHFYDIPLDSEDSTKFALRSQTNEAFNRTSSIHLGHLTDDRIHLEEQRIDFHCMLWFCKLVGEKLFAFRVQEGRNGWDFLEYDLSVNLAHEVRNVQNVGCSIYSVRNLLNQPVYVWSKEKLYISWYNQSDFLAPIVVFDGETLEWSKTKFTGAGYVETMKIDEDDILTISETEFFEDNDEQYHKTVYRLPMRKPDKLRYLAWGTIRRGAMFFGSTVYDQLLPRLPFNSEFRPEFEEP